MENNFFLLVLTVHNQPPMDSQDFKGIVFLHLPLFAVFTWSFLTGDHFEYFSNIAFARGRAKGTRCLSGRRRPD